ncbi:hypothetical protein JW711_00200 [Candidatus Woesearchaeota archaeon]|nr:hypothetical protein [Candidatus Woesearchaeota archaeon]
MSDGITFLGTGGDSIVIGKQLRASGGIVLEFEGNQFMLDPGPGCLVRARQADVNVRDTIAILASHPSVYYSNDLNILIDSLSVSGLDVIGVLVGAKSVIEGTDTDLPVLKKELSGFVERAITLEPGRKISINNINIMPMKTTNPEYHSIGFIFETQKYRVGYTSLTGYSEEVADQYKNCDILIIPCKNPTGVKEDGSMNSEDVAQFLRHTKPARAVLTGFGIKMIQANPMQEARDIQRDSKVEVVAATDGLVISPASFGSKVKHINLDSFGN